MRPVETPSFTTGEEIAKERGALSTGGGGPGGERGGGKSKGSRSREAPASRRMAQKPLSRGEEVPKVEG